MRRIYRPRLRHGCAAGLPRSANRPFPASVYLYVGATLVLGSAAFAASIVVIGDVHLRRPWLLALFAGLVALEHVLSVRLSRRHQGESLAHEEALLVVMALVLPPFSALVAFAIGVLAGQVARPREPLKAVFNVGQLVGSAAIAFTAIGLLAPGGERGHGHVLAVLAGIVIFSVANRASVAGVLSAAGAGSFRSGFFDDLAPTTLVWSGTISIGLLAGLAAIAEPWALPFALAAMIPLSLSFSGHARARRKRQMLNDLVESSAAAIFSVDGNGRILTWNPEMERVSGRSASEAVGRPLLEFVPLRELDGRLAGDMISGSPTTALSERRTVGLEAACGAERWLTLSRSILPDGGFVFVAQDVTEQREAEEEVRESEARLRLALDAGGMGSWEWDMASGEVRWSENLERIYGLPPGGFGGTYEEYVGCLHPDDREFVRLSIERGLAEGSNEFVHRIIRPDGTVRWIEGRGRVVADEKGQLRGMAGVAADVTERKRADALVAIQRRVLERIATGAPVEGVLDLLTRLVEEESGEVLASALLLDDQRRLRKGAAPSLPAAYVEAIDGVAIGPSVGSCGTAAYRNEPVVVADIASDPRWADFRELALGHGLRACWSSPIVATSGEVLGTFAMYYRQPRTPLTGDLELGEVAVHLAAVALERSRQAERLRSAEESYRRLVESLPLAVYAYAPDRRSTKLRALTRYMSPRIASMLGYSAAEWQRDPDLYADVLHPDDRDRVLADLRRARASEDGFRGEYRMIAKDGRTVWVHDESVYHRGPDGSVARVEGYLIDVSDRKALENDLLQAQKMEAIGRLSGGIAHDFNNLMTAVVGFSDLALRRVAEGDPLRAQIEQIQRAGERASAMTHQLLAFSRRQVMQTKVLDLNAVIAESDRLLTRLIGEDIELTGVLDPTLAPVEADPGQMEQVVMNLAINARDAMPFGGRLTIKTANVELGNGPAAQLRPGSYVVLSVADTGIGMDPETQTRIFEPFFTTKDEGLGTGLGLATVFGIVKQSGGGISVRSEPGEGTTFDVYLPSAAGDVAPNERPPAVGNWPEGSETVLVVDDEDAVRSLEREVLAECGYTVLEARHPREALEISAAHDGPIDLLLTDVVMPEVSGRELAARLTRSRPEMKVLYTSGYADDAVLRHGVLESGTAFLAKPLTPAALAAKVRGVLEEGQAPESAEDVRPDFEVRSKQEVNA